MKVTKVTTFDHDVTLKSFANGTFAVVYGKQVTKCEDFNSASLELGSCIIHSMQCAGLIEY